MQTISATGAPSREQGPRGSNQSGVRAHNERVVLSLIRRHGALAKAEIARLSGLSPQTASVIMRALLSDALVLAGDPQKGRVGQPSVPMRLNPRGAFSLGLKIGRRTSEMVLMDFVGTILSSRAIFYPYPRRPAVMDFAAAASETLLASLDPAERARVAGLGVGLPFELWSWGAQNGASAAEMEAWRESAPEGELNALTGLPVFAANDVTAACGAEQAFGQNASSDYLYIFIGAFVGGGIVIDGRLVWGRSGNAGAIGSMPVPNGHGGFHQLIDAASIHVLETVARRAGLASFDLWHADADWSPLGPLLDAWIEKAGRGLAHAALSALAVYDFEAMVIDGSFSPEIRAGIAEATARNLARLDRRGLTPLTVREGTIGREAREVGSASLPFFARYFLDQRVLYAER